MQEINRKEYTKILNLIHKEVIPAIGCTEPIAVALAVAKATSILQHTPHSIKVLLSPNIYKNAIGVGIPNTGMTGLPIAIALGATIGDADKGLEVLCNTNKDSVEEAKQYLASNNVSIGIDKETTDVLYIKCEARYDDLVCETIISGSHTNFTSICLNGKQLLCNTSCFGASSREEDAVLSLRKVYEFALNASCEDLEFLYEGALMNYDAASKSFSGEFGHGLGRLLQSGRHCDIFGDGILKEVLSYTSGACDARMSGAMIPVMSNSGSGNQGISASVPVLVFGRSKSKSKEEILRALAISNLTVIYIKQTLGRLSALCGCVVAATGSSCGITYLMGGGYEEISYAVKNMIGNITGMICDGAKPSCSLKVSSGVTTAMLSAVLAIEHKHISSYEGIIDEDVDKCIQNMTNIGRLGMQETDKMILKIMTTK